MDFETRRLLRFHIYFFNSSMYENNTKLLTLGFFLIRTVCTLLLFFHDFLPGEIAYKLTASLHYTNMWHAPRLWRENTRSTLFTAYQSNNILKEIISHHLFLPFGHISSSSPLPHQKDQTENNNNDTNFNHGFCCTCCLDHELEYTAGTDDPLQRRRPTSSA